MRLAEINGSNMELTAGIKTHVEDRLSAIAKLTEKWEPCDVRAEVGKTSNHHNKGDVFRAEFNLTTEGGFFRAESVKDDLYAAIDQAAADLRRQIVEHKDKLRAGGRVAAESVDVELEEEI